jgi:hypothetical protein
MIRNVVVHITNEQPIMVDLLLDPRPSDVALVCTNLRTMGGKKPVFIDKPGSTFVLPLAHIRFIEMSEASIAESGASFETKLALPAPPLDVAAAPATEPAYEAVPLGRLAWLAGVADEPPEVEPEQVKPSKAKPDKVERDEHAAPPNPDELDPELLRRIHEV